MRRQHGQAVAGPLLNNHTRERGIAVAWWVYILRCKDGTLYGGSTDDLQRRLALHNAGKGAKYTRGRGPVEFVYYEECPDRSAAVKRESAIKKLKRPAKLRLIAGFEAQTREEKL